MTKKSSKKLTMPEAFERAAQELDGIVETKAFYERVAALYQGKTTSLTNRLSQHIRFEGAQHVIRVDAKHVAATNWAMRGIQWRLLLTDKEIEHGLLSLDLAFRGYLIRSIELDDISLIDHHGEPISLVPAMIETSVESMFGLQEVQLPAIELKEWFTREGVVSGDSLILGVVDWATRQYQLTREPAGTWAPAQIEAQNKVLADALFSD